MTLIYKLRACLNTIAKPLALAKELLQAFGFPGTTEGLVAALGLTSEGGGLTVGFLAVRGIGGFIIEVKPAGCLPFSFKRLASTAWLPSPVPPVPPVEPSPHIKTQ